MNAARRKIIAEASALLAQFKSLIETAASEERDYFDAMPENMQLGERGQKASDVADDLDQLVSEIEDIDSRLETAVER